MTGKKRLISLLKNLEHNKEMEAELIRKIRIEVEELVKE